MKISVSLVLAEVSLLIFCPSCHIRTIQKLQDQAICTGHLGTIEVFSNDGDNVKHIYDSDHADVEDVDFAEHASGIGHTEGVEHVNGIEHDEVGEHSEEAKHYHVGGEDDAYRIVHVEPLGVVENFDHVKLATHNNRDKYVVHSLDIDDNRRYLRSSEVADSSNSQHCCM